jgi:hypothetical protein
VVGRNAVVLGTIGSEACLGLAWLSAIRHDEDYSTMMIWFVRLMLLRKVWNWFRGRRAASAYGR